MKIKRIRFNLLILLLFIYLPCLSYSQNDVRIEKKFFSWHVDKSMDFPFEELSGVWKIIQKEIKEENLYLLNQKLKYLDFPKLISKDSYYDFTLSAKLYISSEEKDDQAAGLIFRYRNSFKYYMLVADAKDKEIDLIKFDHSMKIIKKFKYAIEADKWFTLSIKCNLDNITALIDGKELFSVIDDTSTGGKLGLVTYKKSIVYFSDVNLEAEVLNIPGSSFINK